MASVATDAVHRKAGKFADERFRARRRAWLRRVGWAIPIAAVPQVGITAGLGLLLQPEHVAFYWGAGIGSAAALAICLADSPPNHIER